MVIQKIDTLMVNFHIILYQTLQKQLLSIKKIYLNHLHISLHGNCPWLKFAIVMIEIFNKVNKKIKEGLLD